MSRRLALLREKLGARLDPAALSPASRRVALGLPSVDARLGGGLIRAGLHEAYAESGADSSASTGFGLALARRAAGAQRPIIWVRQDMLSVEMGQPYPPGLAEIGVDPGAIVFLRVRDAKEALQAGAEAGGCPALGATLIEIFGRAGAFDLTASRRLALAAGASGSPIFVIRAGAAPTPSAAATRWRIKTLPSRALAANAPGFPAFDIALLRQRGGEAGHEWRVEWNRDRVSFEIWRGDARAAAAPALPRAVAALSADGAAAA